MRKPDYPEPTLLHRFYWHIMTLSKSLSYIFYKIYDWACQKAAHQEYLEDIRFARKYDK